MSRKPCLAWCLAAALLVCLGAGCGGEKDKGKNSGLDKPQPAQEKPSK